jgi:hypothetical protein
VIDLDSVTSRRWASRRSPVFGVHRESRSVMCVINEHLMMYDLGTRVAFGVARGLS